MANSTVEFYVGGVAPKDNWRCGSTEETEKVKRLEMKAVQLKVPAPKNRVPLGFFALKAAVLFLLINFEVIGPLRLTDIFLFVSFALLLMTGGRINLPATFFFLMALILVSTSNLIASLLPTAIFRSEGIAFYYKYTAIYVTIILSLNHMQTVANRTLIFRLLFYVSLLISLWSYAYSYLRVSGHLIGNWRPSYPLSDNYLVTDSHVLSNYLGFFLLSYVLVFSQRFGHSAVVRVLLSGFFLGSILLTGGRTGVVVLAFGMLMYWGVAFLRMLFAMRMRSGTIAVVVLAAISGLALMFFSPAGEYFDAAALAYNRISNLDFGSDASSISRIQKLQVGISDAEQLYFVLGLGFFSSSLIWYDGIVGILFAHGGFALIVLCITGCILIIIKAIGSYFKQQKKIVFCILLISYVLSNLITEHVFITRNFFPIVTLLTALYLELSSANRPI